MFKDTKYLLAYLTPIAAWVGIKYGGILAPGAFWIGFFIIPLIEFAVPGSKNNLSPEEENRLKSKQFFDILLYLNLPILYFLLYSFFNTLLTRNLEALEYAALLLNLGTITGVLGINVAHELGHRHKEFEKMIARILLVPALYGHFTIEHNCGHHVRVGTPEDPATARRGESIYQFWIRSISLSWVHAWQLEARRLRKLKRPFLSIQNELIWLTFFQFVYLVALWIWGGVFVLLSGMAIALLGILLLESVNYIEHYGISRQVLPDGKFEKQTGSHSWNSNHELGRIFLYELTRHADHHMKPTRKYQLLKHLDESPQLPCGYPASILMALIPPLWFTVMDPKLQMAGA